MTDGPDNLPLRYLRKIDEKLDLVLAWIKELTTRTGHLEQMYAGVSTRVDRIDSRTDRIERGWELNDKPPEAAQ